jgi:hypothetical protein
VQRQKRVRRLIADSWRPLPIYARSADFVTTKVTSRKAIHSDTAQSHRQRNMPDAAKKAKAETGVKTEVNEYELQRQENIAKNQALLRELQLNAAKQGLGISSKPAASARPKSNSSKSHKKKAPPQKIVKENVPRRTSSRLAGLTADSEVAKRKAEEEYAAMQDAAMAKRQRVSGALDLTDIVVAGKQWDKSENFLIDVSRGKRFERTFTERDVKETTDAELRDLREKMSGLGLYEGFEPNSEDRHCAN